MPDMCRRWALVALVVLMAVFAGGCSDAMFYEPGSDEYNAAVMGVWGRNPDGTRKQAPICYPAPEAKARPGAPAPGPVCFQY